MTVKHRSQGKSSGQRNSARHPRLSFLPKSQSDVRQVLLVVLLLQEVRRGLRGLHVGVLKNLAAGAAELVRVGRRV